MDPSAYFRGLARNNAWANHRLLRACEGLTPEELVAPRSGFFPSLRATLNHILVIDRFYVDALEGGRLGPAAWAEREPCKTLDELRREQVAVDRRLIAVCNGLTAERLAAPVRVNRGAHDQVERCDRLLLHLLLHQVHHRGQAHAMLSSTSVEPPQLDEFFPEGDASLREVDLRALGWTEAELWEEWT
ncbi:DinB family protein [Paraliomyxa miuraensis]|uniref:DinB family protein n=1 Tax=Paraliomyxa miuraensis TaxID=376150 RepID=UPI002259E1B4|nr:DinB family protein [Paraliomyxa miuraensis]MCX4247573.1 DinB family protein [Paraliomyxa miuraensis]